MAHAAARFKRTECRLPVGAHPCVVIGLRSRWDASRLPLVDDD